MEVKRSATVLSTIAAGNHEQIARGFRKFSFTTVCERRGTDRLFLDEFVQTAPGWNR